MEKYPIFDNTGKVKEWLAAERGVAVWPCLALDSVQLGTDMLTPGDGRPNDWRYAAPNTQPARVLTADDIVFFAQGFSQREWADSPRERRAAHAYVEAWNARAENTERLAPIGRVLSRLVLQPVHIASEEKLDDGHPLVLHFQLAAVLWTAIVPTEVTHEAVTP